VAVERPEIATVVEREVRIAARPETVFDFFVDPAKMRRWKGRKAELDPKPGGVYRVEINEQAVVSGEYLEVEAPSRLVFTWGWEGQETGEHAVLQAPAASRSTSCRTVKARSSASATSTCPSSHVRSTGRVGICTSAGW
jgi:uncharacterized protein YndB with AHSA1/START domain